MLHTKVRGNQSTGTGEEFRRDFTIYGLCDQYHIIKFSFPYTLKLTYKI